MNKNHLIGGSLVAGRGETWEVFNPATEVVLDRVQGVSLEQLDEAVSAASRAFEPWSSLPGSERCKALLELADAMEGRVDDLLRVLVDEVGTPISLAEFLQVRMGIDHLRWQAEAATVDRTEFLGAWDVPVPTMSEVAYRPVGAVAAITGYNYPLNLAIFKFGAALSAGCTAVLMPSPRTPLTTLLLAEVVTSTSIPPGVLNIIAGGADIARGLTEHSGISHVSFTGSDAVGSQIMAQASRDLKGVTLELGGKSPSIVLPGVDVEEIVTETHMRWSRNGGQGCAALARLLVHESLYQDFIDATPVAFEQMKVGDPWDPATTVGPMIRPEHRDRVQGHIDAALAEGGKIVGTVADPVPARGWYVNPVLIAGLDHSARAVQEEIFGPVAVILPFKDEEEAIRLANDTTYGLAANVWCSDPEHGRRLASRIRAGTVWVNGGGSMRPDAPFGGFGRSGIGREIGELGVREYLQPQHVQWRI